MDKYKSELGTVIVPETLFKSKVRALEPYFRESLRHKKHVKRKLDALVDMLCFIHYAVYVKKGEVLSSGELRVASPLFRLMYGKDFKNDFEQLVKLHPTMFSIRQGLPNSKRVTSFGIDCNSVRRIVYNRLDESSDRYKRLQNLNNVFMKYVQEHTEHIITDTYKEWADNYRKYTIDMKLASEISKKRNGYSFEEALKYFKENQCFKPSDPVFLQNRRSYNEYFMCKSFADNSFIVKEVYGRLYTPFHNLSKQYRPQFVLKSTAEKITELVDMKGAFVRGGLYTTAFMMQEFGRTALFNSILQKVNLMSDPYVFAMSDQFSRSDIKQHVLSFFFAKPSHIKYRDTMYAKIESTGSVESILNYCNCFLKYIEDNPAVVYQSYKALNQQLSEFRHNPYILKLVRLRMLYFASRDSRSKYNISKFIATVQRWREAIMHSHIKQSFISYFGSDIYNALLFSNKLFDYATSINMTQEQVQMNRMCSSKYVKPYLRQDLSFGNTINTSIICQLQEGTTMFESVLPVLKEMTGCSDLVSLHDAVFCPESYVNSVDKQSVVKILDDQFFKGLFQVYTTNKLVRHSLKLWKCIKGDCTL